MMQWVTAWAAAGAVLGQFVFAAFGLYALLRLLPRRPVRWKRLAFLTWRKTPAPDSWLKMFGIRREGPSYQERELLLAGCGFAADPAWYLLVRRAGIAACLALAALAAVLFQDRLLSVAMQLLGGIPLLAAFLMKLDRVWLRALRKMRAMQLTKEIYVISNQLLYLADSTLNIHTKLMRCVPYTKVMRGDLERMLAEWYHDPAVALREFKQRIGTDDGMSFAETIDALRQHESVEYYELLRVRISDYKEKLELAKESRKESTSYALFIIAGVPILYTFQVFIYPWVREGQKLFQSLG
ncbi:hypothetical protein [Paenibacillus soyae]|uniref:Uncharacterized protein n=1 Tax=Paenibacillus soyae TaxID=2969249 RepID=A0A9X2MNJ3_9BACL|nr:hypothetical protein [Paenibacillus soyae]MCR2803342.1 hypothetical protein [Paenibacillus soyae]